MKLKLYLIAFCSFALLGLSASTFAQTAQWIEQTGTGGISNGVSSDAAGNCYATGMVNDPALFDNMSIPAHAADVFLSKYDNDGQLLWATVAGGDLIDQGYDIATDPSGNSFVVGEIQTNSLHPTATFGNITLTGHGDYDWFVAKFDVNGNVAWAKNGGSTGGDFARGVALDPAGNLYVCGLFSNSMTVDGVTVTSAGLFDVFLAKFDPNGALRWLRRAGGSGSDLAYGIARDTAGNFGVVGEFQKKAFFDSHSVVAAGLSDAFIAKYDPAGNNLWVHRGGSNISFAPDRANAISTDASDNFYVTGEYNGSATFDGLTLGNTGTSGSDIFIAKYNSAGVIQWLHHGGGLESDKGFAVGTDAAGNSFVSGFASSGPGVVFDTIELAPLGNEYIFLAKYDSAGVVQYVKQYAAGMGQDIHVLGDGCLFFSGGASKGNGHEFDEISLLYVDRGGFIGKFCDAAMTCDPPNELHAARITSSSARLLWNAIDQAQGYVVQYRKVGTTRWRTKSTNTASLQLKKLAPATTYEFEVATICADGNASDFSPGLTFTTRSAP